MAQKKKKLMIIDGNALIHRSFHALPPTMATKKGEMVNAVYGFASFMFKAIKEHKPEYVVLTLDKKGPTFRHEQYEEYKANRVKAPDELYEQIPKVKKLVEAFSIPIYELSGFEADDLIGTIAKQVGNKAEKIIVTGDMDTLQLIDEDTKVYTMSRGITDSVLYEDAQVKERYGLSPSQMIDYKALRGDPSDNIPGVRGIGEKTAVELLQNFNDLDCLYRNMDSEKIKARIKDLLLQNKEAAYMSKELATIKQEAPIDFDLESSRFCKFDQAKVVKVLSEFEFKSLLPRVYGLLNGTVKETKEERAEKTADKFERNRKEFNYKLIDKEVPFRNFLKELQRQDVFVFDTETSGFDPITARLLGISFCWEAGVASYIFTDTGLAEKKSNAQTSLFSDSAKNSSQNSFVIKLKPILEDEKVKKIGHNIKFDIKVMGSQGVDVKNIYFDTMIASYLLNPGTRQHNLDALTFSELGHEKITKDDLLGKGREKVSFGEADKEKLSLYSCEDADFTFRLVKGLEKQLKQKGLFELFKTLEMPLVSVLAQMEMRGIRIDPSVLEKLKVKVAKRIKGLEKKIFESAGEKFNINSTMQLREVLYEKLEIPTTDISRGKTGLSTSADDLEKLKDLHPIIRPIQEYRELAKLMSTYIDALPELINKKTGRMHTSFNQAVTATGRLSSTEPNLQNIPVKTELGREIRKAFVADKGFDLVSFDYSQIELRLAAHMSGDSNMIEAFKNGEDIHRTTAALINDVEPGQVTKEMRREAKAVNFGILYGQGPHGLSQTADIAFFKAKQFIDQYYKVYGKVKEFIEETIKKAKEEGYVETMFGRRRYLPEINSSVVPVRKAAERMAFNAPIQGTAADLIKTAMVEIDAMLKKEKAEEDVRMLLTVHDELLFEIKKSQQDEYIPKIKDMMENAIKLSVPLVVDAKIGNEWGEMKKI